MVQPQPENPVGASVQPSPSARSTPGLGPCGLPPGASTSSSGPSATKLDARHR